MRNTNISSTKCFYKKHISSNMFEAVPNKQYRRETNTKEFTSSQVLQKATFRRHLFMSGESQ